MNLCFKQIFNLPIRRHIVSKLYELEKLNDLQTKINKTSCNFSIRTTSHFVPSFFRLGAHYETNDTVGTEQDMTIAKIIMHENYQTPLQFSNDIALIKLASPADLGKGVGLVCMPDTRHPLPFYNVNKKCWITGWGRLTHGGSQPITLQQAAVPLVSKQRCSNANPGYIDDSMLCAGPDAGGVGICQGDSGGPLVCEFNSTWYLEGASSFAYGCAEPYKYGVYANIRNLKSWLSTNMYTVVAPPSVSPQNQSSALGEHIRYVIYQTRETVFSRDIQTLRRVEITARSGVFLTEFEVIG